MKYSTNLPSRSSLTTFLLPSPFCITLYTSYLDMPALFSSTSRPHAKRKKKKTTISRRIRNCATKSTYISTTQPLRSFIRKPNTQNLPTLVEIFGIGIVPTSCLQEFLFPSKMLTTNQGFRNIRVSALHYDKRESMYIPPDRWARMKTYTEEKEKRKKRKLDRDEGGKKV